MGVTKLCIVVFGCLFTTNTNLSPKSPLNYFVDTPLGAADRYHSENHFHDDRRQTRFCSCGKCSLIVQFRHSCPAAYNESRSPLSIPRRVLMRHYTFTGNPALLVDDLPNFEALLQESKQSNSVLHLLTQCFRFKGAHPCTYMQDDWCIVDLFHLYKTLSFKSLDTDKETLKLRCFLHLLSIRPLTCNHFIIQLPRPSQTMLKIRRYLILKFARSKGGTDPRYAANFALLLLLLSGDVELNPGPNMVSMQILKRLTDNIEFSGLHTHRAIIRSAHMSLLPESRELNARKTLETLYEGLCASTRYQHCSDCIVFYVVELLRLDIETDEKRILREQADLQANDVLMSRQIKFVDLLTFLSYVSKERLVEAKILPTSARKSKEDAAEVISNFVQRGELLPTSMCLQKLLKSTSSGSIREKIKAVLDSPEWVGGDHILKANVATKTLKSLKQTEIVELDSPKSQDLKVIGGLGDEHVSSPTIRELAVFPTLGDAWKNLGAALSVDVKTLQTINKKSPTLIKKQRELFRAYLKINPDPSWSDIINALIKIGKHDVAKKVIETFNLSSELLATTQKSVSTDSSLTAKASRVESDGGPLVPARVSKTEVHSSTLISPSGSGKPRAKPRIESDSRATSLAEVTVASPTMSTRISKTERLSPKNVDPSHFDSSKSLPKSRIVSDSGGAESVSPTTYSMPKSRVVSDSGAAESLSPINLGHSHFDSSKPLPKSRIVSDDGGAESLSPINFGSSRFDSSKPPPKSHIISDDGGDSRADSHIQSEDSTSFLPVERDKTAQIPIGSDSIDGGEVHSSVSISSRELSLRKEVRQSSDDNSPSSDDFHSAEEIPLDSMDEKQGDTPRSRLSHHNITIKSLRGAVMSRNVEEILRHVNDDATMLNATLEVSSGQTALHLAAKLGFKDVAKVLLQRKASVTVKDSNGCTPLYLAASSGNYEIAKMIIASPDCDVNTWNKDGTPVLYDPASKGFSMICELLLENGANPLTETRAGESPLYIASKNGHKDVVKLLLKFKADPTRVCTETSKTPLQEAIDNQHIDVTKLLMEALSEINKKNERLFVCETAERVHELVKHGANVDTRKANGSTPLIAHSATGNKEVVQALIEEKANVDIQDDDGWSALMVSSQSGYIEIVRSLIYVGAIPDLKNKEGLTALMCATLAAQMNVIKELLLAKADPTLKRRDGRSALEIAEQYGNQEIITALKRHTTTASPGNDPLYSLLGSYLELKKADASEKLKNGDKASHDHMAVALKRRESLSSLLPVATADGTSTAKQELDKCYKRIADLETRIHDLTLRNSVEVPVETDLAYLERKRLEDEYSKLKELKRKAEQYAIEAKQTAQRLSAENSKLREDLSNERSHNEFTRNNIIREFEQKSSQETGTMGEEKLAAAKMEVLDKEIEDKAYQLVRRMPQGEGHVKRIELTAVEIKEVVLEKRITINYLELAVMGLPLSGKTELLHQMLELKVEASLVAQHASMLGVHEAVLCHDQFSESHTWIKSSKEDCSVQSISVALAKTLVCMHKPPLLSSCMTSLIDPNHIMEEFPDLAVNNHFKAILENVQKVALQLESKGSLDMLMTSSLSILNLANTKVGKVAYEISCAIASRCNNLLILNLLNLERDSPENLISASDDSEQSGTNIKHTLMKPESALHCYMDAAHVAARKCDRENVIMVGTHRDKLNQGKLKEAKKNFEKITMGYAENVGIAGVICPGMECINTKIINDCERLLKRITELINRIREFQYNIPIRYLFLLSYLQNLNQMFISRRRLVEVAHMCGVTDEDEIEEFLTIFNECGSLLYSKDDEIPILKDYIILKPFNFIKALDKLDHITTMSFDDKLELFEEVNHTKLGFISGRMAAYLWPGEGDGKMTQAHFILNFLKEFKGILPSNLLQLETEFGKAGGGRLYYMPILRADYDGAELKEDTDSLIIAHNNAVVPFRLLTDMIRQIQSYFGTTITFDPKPHKNTICFKWYDSSQDQREANIVITFHTQYVEISVQFPNQAPCRSTATRIYSQLKTACVQIFQLLSVQIKRLNYQFAVVCPNLNKNSSQSLAGLSSIPVNKVHFIQFHPLIAEDKFFCQSCQKDIPSDKLSWAKSLWTQVAYQGPIRDVASHEGYLTNEHIAMLCQSLASHLDLHTIDHFAKQLRFSKEDAIKTMHPFTPLENLLHFLFFTWRSTHPINSVESLAKILYSCGCYQEAIRLNPLLLKSTKGHELSPSLTDYEWSSIAAYVPQSTVKQLMSSTGTKNKADSPSQREDSSRETVTQKLKALGYHGLAVAVEIGWSPLRNYL